MLVGLPDPEHPAVAPAAPDRCRTWSARVAKATCSYACASALASAPFGPSRRTAARNEAIACSNRRSIRSMKPSNGIFPVAGRSAAS